MGCGQAFPKQVPSVPAPSPAWSSPSWSSPSWGGTSDGFWLCAILEILCNVLLALF